MDQENIPKNLIINAILCFWANILYLALKLSTKTSDQEGEIKAMTHCNAIWGHRTVNGKDFTIFL